MTLVEESCVAQAEGDLRTGLTKAKEASFKERSLIKMQEQHGLGDHHNIDLTYAVCFVFLKCIKIVRVSNVGSLQFGQSICSQRVVH